MSRYRASRPFKHASGPTAGRRPRGFTLLELLVAITLMVIVALSLAASMRIGFKARDSAESAVEPGRTAELAFEAIRSDLESAAPPRGILAGAFTGTPSTDEKGESDDVFFYSTTPGPQHVTGTGEVKQIEILAYTDPTTGEHMLVRRVTGNLLSEVEQQPDEEVLCRNVGSFTLMYYDGTDWVNSWDSTQYDNTLPSAIQMILELERPTGGINGQTQILRFTRTFQIAGYNPPGTWELDNTTTTGAGTGTGTGTTGTGTTGTGTTGGTNTGR
jgi:type II secretion system protein J